MQQNKTNRNAWSKLVHLAHNIFILIFFCVLCIFCVFVCVCVVYKDTNLYNDMVMTEVLQGEGYLWGHFQCPHNSKGL